MKHKSRLLAPSIIPISLWDPTRDVLKLPALISDTYINLVDTMGLRELGTTRDPKSGPVGGISKESTEQHFAQAFDGSAARALLALLDPKLEAGSTSNTFIRCTAGNRISLTDAPCGAGAASFTFLSALAELRAEKILPRLPLDVHLIGAELSIHARELAANILAQINPSLIEQGIFVSSEFVSWDVTNQNSNTDLVTKCIQTSTKSDYKLLVVANFSGFLERESKRKDAKKQLDELFRYASGERSFALWIEPHMNSATSGGGLLSWIHRQFTTIWKGFGTTEVNGEDENSYISESRFLLPLQPSQTARVGLAVVPIILDRKS
ncbi:MAG: hypothetical protein PSV17_05505 [Methylotenera sp.]|uniref:hypothetical protein n=1 Tax=Methylotenera sp. TaxID=2051956 RepID=UPI002489542F|nr:hypothetical protein [Methylotenera sp.]MDI1308873.1 hypothetical protein [Methylotenera sp.]